MQNLFSAVMTITCLMNFTVALAQSAEPATKPERTVDARQNAGAFTPHATRVIDDLKGFQPTTMPRQDAFGGVLELPQAKATGFFRTERIDDRWWLIDPEGYREIETAVTSVNIGSLSDEAQRAFDSKFGSEPKWAAFTRDLLHANGFDGTGAWSDDDLLQSNAAPPLVRTPLCSFMAAYAHQHGGTVKEAGHTGFPNKCMFLFEPDFPAACDRFAQPLSQQKNDPYILGYFSDNEIPFPLDALDRFLTLPTTDPGRKAADGFITARHAKLDALTDEDRQAWMAEIAERYFSTVSAAIRKYDPNHLYLGTRFYSTDYRNDALLKVAGKYIDIMSMNLYSVWTPKPEVVRHWSELTRRPVIITEFYAKAEDSGLTNKDGAGWLVHTQRDRADFYQNFTLALLESRVVVGWHWFRYADNDPTLRSSVNASDSNKGILSRTFVPYPQLLQGMKQLNESRYALVGYFDH